ncbi:MAG: glycoside hydrolase family 43 C-terminal domain-containing protein, partial [Bacteroidota bacterium]
NRYFLVHHVRTYSLPDYWFYMNVRPFFLNRFEWPVVAPNRYNGESLSQITLPDGKYGFIQHLRDNNAQSHRSERISLSAGKITGAVTGSYRMYDAYRIELIIDNVIYDGVVLQQYDSERKKDVISFTAMSEDGLSIWGNTQLE